jgi:hypothetical protein
MRTTFPRLTLFPVVLLGLAACGDTETPEEQNAEEVITTVELAWVPATGGEAVVTTWDDADGDGTPAVDTVTLTTGTTYAVSVRFLNALESPAEDITTEVAAESDQHQVFFTGTGVEGPGSASSGAVLRHAYADTDPNGLPVGLENTVEALVVGSGELVVTLQHLPEEGGVAVKVAGLAEGVASGGFSSIPGEADASVGFPVTVE